MNSIRVSRCAIPSVKKGETQVLMGQRSIDCRHNGGLFELPGGTAEAGESLIDTVVREASQETGLDIQVLTGSPVLAEARRIHDGKHAGRQYLGFGVVACRMGGELRLSPEHSDLVMLGLDAAMRNPFVTEGSKKILTALMGPILQIAPTLSEDARVTLNL
ncbi:hypothetical protein BH23PAT1_BH23PAT1_2880 [soil metagenome]